MTYFELIQSLLITFFCSQIKLHFLSDKIMLGFLYVENVLCLSCRTSEIVFKRNMTIPRTKQNPKQNPE